MNDVNPTNPVKYELIYTTNNNTSKSIYMDLAPIIIDDTKIIYGKHLGSGTYGNVFSCKLTHESKETTYAVKCVTIAKMNNDRNQNSANIEILIQYLCNHQNILRIHNWFHNDACIFMLMDYMPNGDLYHILYKQNNIISPENCKSYIIQLWSCLEYLHSNNIIHRDIKPENILLCDSCKTIKLADFGLACIVINDNFPTETTGTVDYMAPEVLLGIPYDYSADVWSTGIILYELINRENPTSLLSDKIARDKIISGDITLKQPNINDDFKNHCFKIVNCILKHIPKNRLSPNDCINMMNTFIM